MSVITRPVRRQKLTHVDPFALAKFCAPFGIVAGVYIFWLHRTHDSGDWSLLPTTLTLACEIPLGVLLTFAAGIILAVLINLSLILCGGVEVQLRDAESDHKA